MITEAKRIANHDRVVELLNSVSRDLMIIMNLYGAYHQRNGHH